MELASYADLAVRLVNTEEPGRGTDSLTSVDGVRALFSGSSRARDLADEADLPRLRAVRTRLRGVFEAAAEGEEVRSVDLLNSLLMEFPVSPLVSGHDHLDEAGRPAGTCTSPTTRRPPPRTTAPSPAWAWPST